MHYACFYTFAFIISLSVNAHTQPQVMEAFILDAFTDVLLFVTTGGDFE